MKNNEDYIITDVTAQEVALHTSLVVCADYVRSWGLHDFLYRLSEYSDDGELHTFVSLLEKYNAADSNDLTDQRTEEENN